MFKNYLNILSTSLSELFIVNNTRYAYFTRQHNDLHVDIGLKEGVYKLFSFMVFISGTIFLKKNP